MISETLLELSRWQFALTAMFHFLYIPLTLGLSVMLVIWESRYVHTGCQAELQACRFWGQVFAVNFALGFATSIAMLFQFGSNGSYFALYTGDVFAIPLAVEILTVFFIAAVLFGPYNFGWERLSKTRHLSVTCLLALMVNLSAIAVLTASGWMQNPLGAAFNHLSFRIESTDFGQLLSNPAAHAKILHTISAAYATAAASVLAISAWILQKQPGNEMARASFKLAAIFGLVSSALICLGDATPELANPVQNLKLAALTGANPESKLPDIEQRIRNGVKAYNLLQDLRDENKDPQLLENFNRLKPDLGYGLLLKRWTEHVETASDKLIAQAARYCLPGWPALLFWVYRCMILAGITSLLLFAGSAWTSRGTQAQPAWLLKASIYFAPLPWLACIGGWYIAVGGMQPWAIAGLIPTFLSASSGTVTDLAVNSSLYSLAYAALLACGLLVIGRLTARQTSVLSSGERP